jgi:hypothetical protein
LEFRVIPAGDEARAVDAGIAITLTSLSTLWLIDGVVSMSTRKVPFLTYDVTPFSRALRTKLVFPPAWRGWLLLTVNGPPVADELRLKPLPVMFDPATMDERFPNPKVRLGTSTEEDPLLVILTLSLMVAKPYRFSVYWLMTAILGAPWATAGAWTGIAARRSNSKRAAGTKRLK